MFTPLRRKILSRLSSLALAFVLLNLLAPAPAQADVGVHPILPGGSSLQPGQATSIQMAAEVVRMNVRAANQADNAAIELTPDWYGYNPNSVWYPAVAEVEADFTMRNPTSSPVSMDAWFPLAFALKTYGWAELSPEETVPRIASFQVSVDGSPVEYAVSELPNPNGAGLPYLPWASFPVTFPAAADAVIHVSYLLPLAQPAKSNALVLFYVFQTGAGWAGPIGQAELIVTLPYPASVETLSGMPAGSLNPPYYLFTKDEATTIPPGAVLEGNQARWSWQNWEPRASDDFALLLLHPGAWEALQAARVEAESAPGDGQAWLKLCQVVRSLSVRYHAAIPTAYSAAYVPSGIEACQGAARLLPGDAAPHYFLAWFHLFALADSPSLETLEPALFELRLAQALEAEQKPSKAAVCDSWGEVCNAEYIESSIAGVYPNSPEPTWAAALMAEVEQQVFVNFKYATATAGWVTITAEADATRQALLSATASPTDAPSQTLSPSATLTPSVTPESSLTSLPTATETPSGEDGFALVAAGGALGLVVVGLFVLRALKKRGRGG